MISFEKILDNVLSQKEQSEEWNINFTAKNLPQTNRLVV